MFFALLFTSVGVLIGVVLCAAYLYERHCVSGDQPRSGMVFVSGLVLAGFMATPLGGLLVDDACDRGAGCALAVVGLAWPALFALGMAVFMAVWIVIGRRRGRAQ